MLTERADVARLDSAMAPVSVVEAWYDQHVAAVLCLAVRMMRDHHEAERVVIDAFVSAHHEGGCWPKDACRERLLRLTQQGAARRLRELRVGGATCESQQAPGVAEWPLSELSGPRRSIFEAAFFEGYTNAELAVRFSMKKGEIACELSASFAELADITSNDPRPAGGT